MKIRSIVIKIVVGTGAIAMAAGFTPAADIATDATLRAQAAKSFQQADRDGDQRLSLEEFVQCQPQPEVARRDFQLFDFDAGRLLTRDEFFSCPTVLPPHLRGPMFDPLSRLVDEAVVALDEALGGWNLRPNEELDRNAVLAVINGSTVNPAFEFNLLNGGRAGAATISRAEARQLLEFHLGVRRRDGELLRKPDGRVVNYMLYSYIDLNHNDALDRQEFRERSYAGI
ncbi:MAG: EF-hand domain-containing protein, partial [Planctomycetaceae bacterium]|nr:EF-hand domain-containing protein [Planctomycetaceae bacterium]